jgi:hypothetical protein
VVPPEADPQLVFIRNVLNVILSPAQGGTKNLCDHTNREILRGPACGGTPQNDNRKPSFLMDTSKW